MNEIGLELDKANTNNKKFTKLNYNKELTFDLKEYIIIMEKFILLILNHE